MYCAKSKRITASLLYTLSRPSKLSICDASSTPGNCDPLCSQYSSCCNASIKSPFPQLGTPGNVKSRTNPSPLPFPKALTHCQTHSDLGLATRGPTELARPTDVHGASRRPVISTKARLKSRLSPDHTRASIKRHATTCHPRGGWYFHCGFGAR